MGPASPRHRRRARTIHRLAHNGAVDDHDPLASFAALLTDRGRFLLDEVREVEAAYLRGLARHR